MYIKYNLEQLATVGLVKSFVCKAVDFWKTIPPITDVHVDLLSYLDSI